MGINFKRIAVKIGSNVLTKSDGSLDFTQMSALVDQVAELHRQGVEVILISSGAVAAGRSHALAGKLDAVSERQLFSAIGQVKLINRYYMLFRDYGITCGQVLTTKESLCTRQHYLNQRSCMQVMLAHGVIPIVNENDTIAVTELMFTDNDELSGLVATMMSAEALFILTNVDGIYNGHPAAPNAELIREVRVGERDLSACMADAKSSFGRGGMQTKMGIAGKVADEGVEVVIANGRRADIICELWRSRTATPCTRFVPAQAAASSVKKWLAHSEGFAKGELHINANARQALLGEAATSLLPVGVTAVCGDFEKGDIVKIFDERGTQIAIGKTQYGSDDARRLVGERGKKPVVHYDYLCLKI
ncbi:MAG: glutamate 5-kinase [Prevotellaceae bacterium]|nr:glutamate 5-kinase [Prevotellaceae bacterium]